MDARIDLRRPTLYVRLSLLVALGGAQACGRTPPEDFASVPTVPVATALPRATTGAAAISAFPSPSRCVLTTALVVPPAVPPGPAPGCPADPERSPSAVKLAHVTFPSAAGAAVEAELVRSPHDTARGLMYRTSMPENRGMLFDLGTRDDHKFWMHNTCIPLDLLYVDDDGLIVGIVENAPTLNDEARGVGCPSVYVLEVNAGWSRRHGVKAGQQMRIPADVTNK